ncbi:MAG: L,D-transpeptidase family protein, partial [Acidimicrobiales bacterium]
MTLAGSACWKPSVDPTTTFAAPRTTTTTGVTFEDIEAAAASLTVDPGPATTTTEAAPALAPPSVPEGLARGARGSEVLALEQRLDTLRYEVGKVDGVFDADTGHGVMAFQKAVGMERTGRATDEVIAAINSAAPQPGLLPDGGAQRVEVDLRRQIVLLFSGGHLERVINSSTGTNRRYCVDGQCATAVTPGGSFKVVRRIKGKRVSRLGTLWNPLYFNGGIAIHGSPSVPANPASHGCVRIPMSTSEWFFNAVANGTPVYVIGGSKAAVPFNEPTPTDGDDAPPAPTTTAPPLPAPTPTTAAPVITLP